jgi:hypothetical protein
VVGVGVDELHAPKSEALRTLFWRSEILQVMYWLRGEGLGEVVDAALLERFLGVDAAIGLTYLHRLVDEGYLEVARKTGADRSAGDGFRLSPRGVEEGAAEFAASFAELTRPAHGECSPDCWCHVAVEEAEACAAERAGHTHR